MQHWSGVSSALFLCVARTAFASPLNSFQPPQPSFAASGGELGAPFVVVDIATCATKCLADPNCISFNVLSGEASCGRVRECWNGNPSTCPSDLLLVCPNGTFSAVKFASYGDPTAASGECAFEKGKCDAENSSAVVAAACIGRSACVIPASAVD